MTPILLSGPAVEPVSLAEVKAWARIDDAREDDLLAALVTSARLVVESLTRRLLINQTWRLVFDAWPKGLVVDIPFAPLRDVVAMRVFDSAGAPRSIAASLYSFVGAPETARVLFAAAPPAPGRPIAGAEIDISVGYGADPGDVPAPLRQAIRALATRWFEQRGDAMGDPALTPLPSAVSALVAPYRRARLS